jgi:hypothetical protein
MPPDEYCCNDESGEKDHRRKALPFQWSIPQQELAFKIPPVTHLVASDQGFIDVTTRVFQSPLVAVSGADSKRGIPFRHSFGCDHSYHLSDGDDCFVQVKFMGCDEFNVQRHFLPRSASVQELPVDVSDNSEIPGNPSSLRSGS